MSISYHQYEHHHYYYHYHKAKITSYTNKILLIFIIRTTVLCSCKSRGCDLFTSTSLVFIIIIYHH